jgi:putative heme-binding domain-containing protein
MHALEDADMLAGLNDSSSGVREHALRLSEPRLKDNPALFDKVLSLAGDDDARVRFQTAFTLGETTDRRSIAALAKIAARDPKDYWVRMAVLSSVANRAGELLAALRANDEFLGDKQMQTWFEQLGTLVGARNDSVEVTAALDLAAGLQGGAQAQRAILLGLGAGLQRSGSSLEAAATSSGSKTATAAIERAIERAAKIAHDDQAPSDDRQDALRLLGYAGGQKSVDVLLGIFDPRQSESMQIAAAKVLARSSDPRIAAGLVAAWRHSTPKVQEEIISVLVSRQSWAGELLAACQRGAVTPAQVAREPRSALLSHQDASLRAAAEKLFGGASSPRHEVIATYQKALALAGDPDRGDKVYQRECMGCHRLGERGFQVGPNLALTRNRTPAALMEAILDPNREVQPSFVSFVVVDDSGRTMTGLLTSESASSITLAREKGGSETILKANIDEMKSTGKSLMPEGLEKTVDMQNMADLLAFLKQVQYDVGTLPDFVEPAEGAKR